MTETRKPRFIDLKEVIKMTSLKTTSIYSMMKKGNFPKSIKITSDRVAWLESDIEDWINKKIKQQQENSQ